MARKSFIILACALAFFVNCAGPQNGSGESVGQQALAVTGTCSTPAQLETDLKASTQAAVISLSGLDPLTCPEVGMSETWSAGKYVFSDSPESPTSHGKLYEDTTLAATSGTDYNRIFVYHTNGRAAGGANMRFAVLLKNTGGASGTLTLQKRGKAGPTTSYLYAGKLAFQRWLDSTAQTAVTVNNNAWVRISSANSDTFDTTNVAPTNLLHGIWDYSFTKAHTIAICALDTTEDPISVCPGLSVPSRDASHQRGTFPHADKVYDTATGVTIDTAVGVQQLPLAGGTTNDTNAVGTDQTDSSSQTLTGNYGILYRMHLATSATDSNKMGFLWNPRGGQWGGAAFAMGGDFAQATFLVPTGSGSTGDNTKGAVDNRYAPSTGLTVWAQWMPTGGSALPLRFLAVPYTP
jgi:hypothetical protein